MVAEQIIRTLSLDEAVDAVYQAAVGGASVADTAQEVAHHIDDRDVHEAIVIGLGELTHRRLARRRKGHESEGDGAGREAEGDTSIGPTSPRAKARPHAAKAFWDAVLDDANYEAADGTRKPLRDFDIVDARKLADLSRARADGHIRVRDAMDRAVGALERTGASTIGALPLTERRPIVDALT